MGKCATSLVFECCLYFDDDKYVTSEKVFITCPYQANLENDKA